MIEPHTIIGCRRGDRRSQLELYRALAPCLYSSCLRIVGSTAEAEEAMQDAILKLLRWLAAEGRGDDGEAAVVALAKRIAVNSAIDHLRRRGPATIGLTDDLACPAPADCPESPAGPALALSDIEASSDPRIARIKAALAELAPGYRAVLSLYLFEGFDFEEIGEILRLKPASVRSQYLRARQRLLEMLNR